MERVEDSERMNMGVKQRELFLSADQQLEEIVRQREHTGIYLTVKRGFDIVFSSCALVVLSPLLILLALIVFLDDPNGGPIFSQERIGKNGTPFRLFKYRTMVVNAEQLLDGLKDKNEMQGHAFKIKDDPRITKVGKFLRQTGLDELPQLWNILCGDMSIVGPRPPLPREVDEYTEFERQRLLVTPGLTCIWQTEKNRNDISFERWVELDIQYIREQNFWLDLKLIMKTLGVVVRRDGR